MSEAERESIIRYLGLGAEIDIGIFAVELNSRLMCKTHNFEKPTAGLNKLSTSWPSGTRLGRLGVSKVKPRHSARRVEINRVAALAERHVPMNPNYPLCKTVKEDEFHALCKCMCVKAIWCASRLGDFSAGCESFLQWWNEGINRFSKAKIEELAYLLLSIWNGINVTVWRAEKQLASKLIYAVKTALSDWRAACKGKQESVLTETEQAASKW
ncbi:hypothetical protein LguiA_006186 [Lonicera macranthoides]